MMIRKVEVFFFLIYGMNKMSTSSNLFDFSHIHAYFRLPLDRIPDQYDQFCTCVHLLYKVRCRVPRNTLVIIYR